MIQHVPHATPSSGWSRVALLSGVAVIFVLGLVVDRCTERAGRPAAMAEAQRIWLDGADQGAALSAPASFWAIKDFALTEEQRVMGASGATLLVIGDPSVLVYWNGVLVHSSEYRLGQAVRRLKVAPLLEARNRVVLEGRSSHGGGGLMAALWLQAPASSSDQGSIGEPVWVTDQSWLTTQTFSADVLSGLLLLTSVADLAPVKAWSKLDLGRWQPLEIDPAQLAASWPSQRQETITPISRSLHTAQPHIKGEPEPWPNGVLLTFEEQVEGCLGLAGADLFSRRIFFFEEASLLQDFHGPRELASAHGQVWANRSERVVAMSQSTSWLDSQARSFGAVFLEGAVPLSDAAGLDGSTAWVQRCAGSQLRAPVQRLSLGGAARRKSP